MATFARAVVDGLDGIVVKDGKTHRAYVVALDPATVEVLRRHLQACRERAAVCGASLADRGFVFSFDPDGHPPLEAGHGHPPLQPAAHAGGASRRAPS